MTDFQSRVQSAIGHEFLLERELGGGGMSRVFVAIEKALGRRVVVKVLPPEFAAGVNVERFRREIQLAAGLQHPHIVPLLAAGDDNGLLWFSMPYIEGESLRGAIVKHGRLAPRDVVRILHDVVDALAYAHQRGIVHRDIKPDNVLASGMHALVTDFGVAKALSAAVPIAGGTTTGMAIGTPQYMAPEQLAADPAADHRVDIYAIGLLAYELLTGKSPFSGASPQATLAAQLTKTPEPPHLEFHDVPPALSAIIMHCLEKDAARRPQQACELLAALDELPPLSATTSVFIPGVKASRRRAAAPTRRSRIMKGLAAVAGVIAIAAVAAAIVDVGAREGGRLASADSAREAGAPGANGRGADARGDTARTPSVPATAARPETVIVVYRDPGASDNAQGTTVPIVISRAESLAIAEAMRKRSAPRSVASKRESEATPEPASSAVRSAAGGANARGATDATPTLSTAPSSGNGQGGVELRTFAGGNRPPSNGPRGDASARPPMGRVYVARPDGSYEFSISRDEILSEVKRVFTDSMMIALRQMESSLARVPRFTFENGARPAPGTHVYPLATPNTDGRTRIVVTNFAVASRRPEMGGVGRDIATFLRGALPADRIEVVDDGLTEKARKVAHDAMSLGWTLRSDFVISGEVRERNDSLVVVAMFTDVRSGHNSNADVMVVPMDEPRRAYALALGKVNGWLEHAKKRGRPAQTLPRVPGMPEKTPENAGQRGSERGS